MKIKRFNENAQNELEDKIEHIVENLGLEWNGEIQSEEDGFYKVDGMIRNHGEEIYHLAFTAHDFAHTTSLLEELNSNKIHLFDKWSVNDNKDIIISLKIKMDDLEELLTIMQFN